MISAAPAAEVAYEVTCGSRTNWYRSISSGGAHRCFSTYGDVTVQHHTLTISTGAKSGFINHQMQRWGTYHDSPLCGYWFRGNFNETVWAQGVRLR